MFETPERIFVVMEKLKGKAAGASRLWLRFGPRARAGAGARAVILN